VNDVGWQREQVDECLVVRPVGALDTLTYSDFRDKMIKFAVDQPRVVIVAIDDLELPVPSALTPSRSPRNWWRTHCCTRHRRRGCGWNCARAC
jgi:hypothetical protein